MYKLTFTPAINPLSRKKKKEERQEKMRSILISLKDKDVSALINLSLL